MKKFTLSIFKSSKAKVAEIPLVFEKHALKIIFAVLSIISIISFIVFYKNGLGLAYNDARSHLDIGRRVVEGLKPGLAQIGSVWLPLPHLLMVPTIWNDFMWHTGLSGAIISMFSYVATGLLVYQYLKELGVKIFGRLVAVAIFALNLNIIYLQSTAMTELLLIATMMAGCYYLLVWQKRGDVLDIIKAAFFIMLSTLNRYDGWFLFGFAGLLILIQVFRKKGYKAAEGSFILYSTLAGIGIVLWFVWNALIFKDPLYFILGPFSAHAQQQQLLEAGVLATKGNLLLSIKVYFYALFFNSYTFIVLLSFLGAAALWFDRKVSSGMRIMSVSLIAPLLFNIIALYFGFSVLYVQGISGNTWFNVRYGVMLAPTIAVFIGYLIHKLPDLKWVIVSLAFVTIFISLVNIDAVTIDDARVGSSQKNVSEVSGWLHDNAANKDGFILISAASHDAIIFSSGLPLAKFIHEGTGAYWESAVASPDRWARWIVMRTYDENDLTYRELSKQDPKWIEDYILVNHYPFADIYEIKPLLIPTLNTKPVFTNQK